MTDTQGQDQLEGTNVEVTATEKPAEEVVVPQEEVVEDQLPDGVAERTREQFEKLKAHNKQLAEKVALYEKPQQPRKSALDTFAPFSQSSETVAPGQVSNVPQITEDQDGYVDVAAINQVIADARDAKERARRAEERVAKYEHTDETRKTYEKHPYLDPYSPDFDQKFSDLTRLEILRQMTEEGRQNYLEAANKVKSDFYDPETTKTQAQNAQVEKQQQVTNNRAQATTAVGGNKVTTDPNEHARLVQGTLKGDRNAIFERLRKSGY